MSKEGEFKVPSIDPKILRKTRKSDTASKVNIPPPSEQDTINASKFEEDVPVIPPVPYKEPSWSGKCNQALEYSFEVEKNGVIIEKIKQLQRKSFWLFGRLPNCDINITHPTSSRYHAVLQYRCATNELISGNIGTAEDGDVNEKHNLTPERTSTNEGGWFLYDLNSTHGTFLNKQQIMPGMYVRVRVGYMIKLGSSSRTFILQGPADDQDEPSSATITEMKEQAKKHREFQQEMAAIERAEKDRVENLRASEGIDWGMAEDADEETDLTENPYATTNNEELFLDDPKKTLRGYFEREGHELDYQVEEISSGTYRCKVELPIDDLGGRPKIADVTHKGKKKEAVLQCALEACRILDRLGLLRQANHAPRRKCRKQSDSDDDDDFLDRTGEVEKRRQRKQTKQSSIIRTYTSLIHDEARILERLEEIEDKIQNSQLLKKDIHLPEDIDDVDKFLEQLSTDTPNDKFIIRRLRLEQSQLRDDLETVKKLINTSKPLELELATGKQNAEAAKQKIMPLYGKRNKLSKTFGIRESDIKAEKDNNMESDIAATNAGNRASTSKSDKSSSDQQSKDKAAVSKSNNMGGTLPKQEGLCGSTNQRKRSSEISTNADSAEGMEKRIVPPENDDEEHDSSKKKRQRHRARENKARENVDYDDTMELAADDKNVVWLPPSGQTGDGRTSLNEKYGY